MYRKIFAIIMVLSLLLLAACKSNETTSTNSKIQSSLISSTETSKQVTSSEQDDIEELHNYKCIALTFDDAPNYGSYGSGTMQRIVSALKKYDGVGTFFVTGNRAKQYGVSNLKYAIDNGFELANHSDTHTNFVKENYSVERIVDDINSLQTFIKAELNYDMKFFRAPELAVNENVYKAAKELGMPVVSCNVGTNDWDTANTTAEMIKEKCLSVDDGSIVLLHCWPQTTASIIEEVCEELYDDDFRFVTLSQLFEIKGKDIDRYAGVQVRSFY